LSLLLDLEHTYQASARLLSTVDEMLKTLLNAV
jgi:flagellar hook-associated protein 1 FlgK